MAHSFQRVRIDILSRKCWMRSLRYCIYCAFWRFFIFFLSELVESSYHRWPETIFTIRLQIISTTIDLKFLHCSIEWEYIFPMYFLLCQTEHRAWIITILQHPVIVLWWWILTWIHLMNIWESLSILSCMITSMIYLIHEPCIFSLEMIMESFGLVICPYLRKSIDRLLKCFFCFFIIVERSFSQRFDKVFGFHSFCRINIPKSFNKCFCIDIIIFFVSKKCIRMKCMSHTISITFYFLSHFCRNISTISTKCPDNRKCLYRWIRGLTCRLLHKSNNRIVFMCLEWW